MTEQKILVPIDFSGINKPMVRLADAWAKRTGAALYFLHVVPDLTDRFVEPGVQNVFGTNDEEIVEHFRKQMQAFLSEQDVSSAHEILVRQGKPYAGIMDVQKEQGADLIIMAAHDHTRAERMFLGSNTDYVLHHVRCSVYVFRA